MKRLHSEVAAEAAGSNPASAAVPTSAATATCTQSLLNDGYHNPANNAAFEYFVPVDDLPYVTSSCPGIGGMLKRTPSHFRVIEIDDHERHAPDGIVDTHGACHIYVTLTRKGLNTSDVQKMLASIVGLETRDIGVCGLKDKWAVCTQTFSVPSYSRLEKRHLSANELASLVTSHYGHNLKIERTAVSSTKLRRNMHSGNRFQIVVSDIRLETSQALQRAQAILAAMASAGGIPNFYGAQRFSVGCQGALRGGRLLLEMQSCRGGSKKKRLRNSITRSTSRRFFLSAFSSMLFNIWLGRRINAGNFGCLLDGDLVVGAEISESPSEEERNTKEENDDKGKLSDGAVRDIDMDPKSSMNTSIASSKVTKKQKKKNGKAAYGHRIPFVRYDQLPRDCSAPSQTKTPDCESLFKEGSCSYTGPMFGARCPVPRGGSEAYERESEVEALSGILHTTYRTLDVFGTRRPGRLVIQDLGISISEWKEREHESEEAAGTGKASAHASKSGLLFSFSLPTGSYATAVLREFCKVPLRLEKADRTNREDEHERAKKRLKSQEPAEVSVSLQVPSPEPMSVEELVECCQENNIPYEVPRMALRQQTYQILYLRGKRKPRRHSLVLFQPNDGSDPNRPRRDIKEWSTLLKYKHTGRLSDEKSMLSSLGCKKTALSPLSVCNRHTSRGDIAPVTVGLERALVDAEEPVHWMNVGDSVGDAGTPCLCLGLRISAFLKLLFALKIPYVVI